MIAHVTEYERQRSSERAARVREAVVASVASAGLMVGGGAALGAAMKGVWGGEARGRGNDLRILLRSAATPALLQVATLPPE